MNRHTAILSLGYWFSAYTLGMLLHPYKTVRELVRLKSFTPMVFTPLVIWLSLWLVGLIGLRFGWAILWLLGLHATGRFINLLAFLFWWATCFLLLWQMVVGYLWLRFSSVKIFL
jgi:hypothetical protein